MPEDVSLTDADFLEAVSQALHILENDCHFTEVYGFNIRAGSADLYVDTRHEAIWNEATFVIRMSKTGP